MTLPYWPWGQDQVLVVPLEVALRALGVLMLSSVLSEPYFKHSDTKWGKKQNIVNKILGLVVRLFHHPPPLLYPHTRSV